MKKVLAIASVMLLGGCAALPVEGPVRIGPDLVSGATVDSLYYSPSPPAEDASQSDILNGFLAAGTGPQNDYAIAREYLSDSIRSSWNPNQEVLIQRTAPIVTSLDQNRVQVDVDLSARIDQDGRYENLPAGSVTSFEFEFVEENGQWRISSAPNATILIRPVFDVLFKSYSIYFLDRQQRFLVPELRWFPTTPATGTRLASSLLRGPSPWLRPAVVSAIPSGTRLAIDAVTVVDGVALVDLTARALVASRADRSLMKAQLQATLSQLPNVQSVDVSIERSPQDIPDPQNSLQADPITPLVLLTNEGLDVISGAEIEFVAGDNDFFDQIGATDLALSRSTGQLAARSESGIYRTNYRALGSSVELVDSRQSLLPPAYDAQQYLWTLSGQSGQAAWATSVTGERKVVSAPWLEGLSVLGFSIAAEGTRITLLVRGEARNRVLLSSIVRDRSGSPISLGEPVEIATEVASPTSVSFVDALQLAVINSGADFTNLYLITIGGTTRSIAAPPQSLSVVSAGPTQSLYLLDQSGQLLIYRSLTWNLVTTEVLAISPAQ